MKVREAQKLDKKHIVDFCKNTFSWGDYISEIWDYWELEGNLMVIEENQKPVALCHASINQSARQLWIEGVRVHPDFRRKGFALTLVENLELIGIRNNLLNSFMLVEINNSNSISLAKKLHYKKIDTWWFYSLLPKPIQINNDTQNFFQNGEQEYKFLENRMYVKSWRWLPLDKTTLQNLFKQKKLLISKDNSLFCFAVLTDSEHFKGTLIVTLFGNSDNLIQNIVQYIQNYAFENKYSRIQILSTIGNLKYDYLQQRYAFLLMKKQL